MGERKKEKYKRGLKFGLKFVVRSFIFEFDLSELESILLFRNPPDPFESQDKPSFEVKSCCKSSYEIPKLT